jgi:predicted flap endonuclease-1-like 5' DNA nuclease
MNADTIYLLGALEPCWLWWLILSALSFILGALLGCLLCSNRKRLKELEDDNKSLKAKHVDLEKEYASLKYQYDEAQAEHKDMKMKLQSCEADKQILKHKLSKLESAKGDDATGLGIVAEGDNTGQGIIVGGTGGAGGSMSAYASIFPETNLQVVEGIGPKLEEVLKEAGITNWKILSGAKEEELRKILTDYNPNYRIHNPGSWPQQAKLASQDKWDELIEYQKFLDGGRDDEGDYSTPSKVEKMAMKIWGFSSDPEDLKVVEGIGPKIETALKAGGINNWQELADAPVERIQEILDGAEGNFRLAVPDTWPQQAGLAAAGAWDELSRLQDELDGGK